MKRYRVHIATTFWQVLDVDADDLGQAKQKAWDMFDPANITVSDMGEREVMNAYEITETGEAK
jgi:hypothetical protein